LSAAGRDGRGRAAGNGDAPRTTLRKEAIGMAVEVWTCNGGTNQKWTQS
jgi:hypothetical protein